MTAATDQAADGHPPLPPLPRPLHAVFLDAGDTILAAHPTFQHRFAEVAAANGVRFEQAAVDAAYADAARRATWPLDWADAAGQAAFWKGFYAGVLSDLGYTDHLGTMADAMLAAFSDPAAYKVFPDTLAALDELAARGLRLGIVSNFEPWLVDVLRLEGIADRFATVAVSGLLGVAKPDPAIFHAALDEAGVAAAETVHVGDSVPADVDGARAAGITPVLLDRFGRTPAPAAGATGPVHRVTSLPELLALLDGTAG